MSQIKNKKYFVLKTQTQKRVQFALDSAERVKDASEKLEIAVIQAEAASSVNGEGDLDLDELCRELKLLHDMMLLLCEDSCNAVEVIEEELQDCLESQEDPPGEI